MLNNTLIIYLREKDVEVRERYKQLLESLGHERDFSRTIRPVIVKYMEDCLEEGKII